MKLPVVALTVVAACAPPPAPPAPPAPPFDPRPWLEDLAQLEHHLGVAYANLEWNHEMRGLDLRRLHEDTAQRLRRAASQDEAVTALGRFLGAFRDPHIAWRGGVLPERVSYEVDLRTDGRSVVVGRVAGPGCEAAPGDEVLTLLGLPALRVVEDNLGLARTGNRDRALDDALHLVLSSRFAPRERLVFTAQHGGREVLCRLDPVKPAAGASAKSAGPVAVAWTTPGSVACAAMGVGAAVDAFGFAPEKHPDFQVLEGPHNSFGAGILGEQGGRRLGWIRIPLFAEEAYPRTCSEEWEAAQKNHVGSCEPGCQDEFRERNLARRFRDDFVARLDQLAKGAVDGIVVDITDNGGGTDWVRDVARALARPGLVCPGISGLRHPHWRRQLEETAKDLAACERPDLAPDERALLERERAWNMDLLDQSQQACDLTPLFFGGSPKCSLLLDQRRAPCDPPPPAAGVSHFPASCEALRPPDAGAVSARAMVPVYVLVNRRTASAAEELAAVLRDNGDARLVGERTTGAGCGHTNGGISVTLAHSRISVSAPDCVRYRRDGTNEIEGLTPDVALSWTLEDRSGRWSSYAEKALSQSADLFRARY